jgi:hypothetical protein
MIHIKLSVALILTAAIAPIVAVPVHKMTNVEKPVAGSNAAAVVEPKLVFFIA